MYKGSFVSCFQRYRPSKSWYSRVNINLSSAHLNGSTNQPDLKNYFVNKNLSYLTFGFFGYFDENISWTEKFQLSQSLNTLIGPSVTWPKAVFSNILI